MAPKQKPAPRFPDDFSTGDCIDLSMGQIRYAMHRIEAGLEDLGRALATLEVLSARHERPIMLEGGGADLGRGTTSGGNRAAQGGNAGARGEDTPAPGGDPPAHGGANGDDGTGKRGGTGPAGG